MADSGRRRAAATKPPVNTRTAKIAAARRSQGFTLGRMAAKAIPAISPVRGATSSHGRVPSSFRSTTAIAVTTAATTAPTSTGTRKARPTNHRIPRTRAMPSTPTRAARTAAGQVTTRTPASAMFANVMAAAIVSGRANPNTISCPRWYETSPHAAIITGAASVCAISVCRAGASPRRSAAQPLRVRSTTGRTMSTSTGPSRAPRSMAVLIATNAAAPMPWAHCPHRAPPRASARMTASATHTPRAAPRA